MSYVDSTFEFDEKNILCLCGYNSSGKSALVRAIDVIFYDGRKSEQKDYVRHGCDKFCITMTFDDGVEIKRYKYSTGNTLWELSRNGELLYTNKNGAYIISVQDVPEPVKKYLGVLEETETGEKLNVRRVTDKMFLISTTGGENYKILSAVLQADILSTASGLLTDDKNKTQNEVFSSANTLRVLRRELEKVDVIPDEILDVLKENGRIYASNYESVAKLSSIINKKSILDDSVVYDEVSVVDIMQLDVISKIDNLYKNTLAVIPAECNLIESEMLNDISRIAHFYEVYRNESANITPDVSEINLEMYSDLMNICNLYNNLYTLSAENSNASKELNDVQNELNLLAKESDFKICDNCGAVVL
jgi:hypothetical protein